MYVFLDKRVVEYIPSKVNISVTFAPVEDANANERLDMNLCMKDNGYDMR